MTLPSAANDIGDARLIERLAEARGHRQAGRAAEAEAAYRALLDADPAHAEALHFVGYQAYRRGQTDEALTLIGRAIVEDPDVAAYRSDLALALWAAGRPGDAAASGRAALALRPGLVEAWLNLGNAMKELGASEEAIACYRRCLALERRRVEAWNQMAIAWMETGRFDLSEWACRNALMLRPTMAEAHYNLALGLLACGRWREGWAEFEWRLRIKAMARGRLEASAPRWDGGSWSGAREAAPVVLVHAEQGLGDTIMFARFAPLVAARGWRTVLAVQPELVGLIADGLGGPSLEVRALSGGADALPPHAAQVSLMSLPALFQSEPATLPSPPYLRADPVLRPAWRARLAAAAPAGLKVGLVWAGNPRAGNAAAAAIDRRRSLALALLAPLAAVGATYFALQLGEAGLEARTPPAGLALVDLGPEIGDFRDSAAIIAELDLLISVDTASLHLAGALGCRTWLMNRFDTDWRWLWQRCDSPWYPSLTIYRQERGGDWGPVVARIAEDLARLAGANTRS